MPIMRPAKMSEEIFRLHHELRQLRTELDAVKQSLAAALDRIASLEARQFPEPRLSALLGERVAGTRT